MCISCGVSVGKKNARRCDLDEETIETLKMKVDLLENENTMLKEMAGSPLLSVKEREGSTTCSSVSTTSSSGDEKGDYDHDEQFLARNQFCYRRTNHYL